jgi:hypothetical protein
MPAIINLKGQQFGRLTVLVEAGRNKDGEVLWLCQCSCSTQRVVRAKSLRSNKTRSCGCLHAELSAERVRELAKANIGKSLNIVHGHTWNLNGKVHVTSTYRAWHSMKARCTRVNHKSYPQYGGAGVAVCERWMKFENFLADMGERPEGTTLSRFMDVGSYTPGNCAWHTWAQQRAEAKKKRALTGRKAA